MKPTINTSPLTWSCTTAGISPSSFEKSIASFQIPYNKKPRLVFRRGCVGRENRCVRSVHSRAQSCQSTVMVVVVMRVVENCDHEPDSVLQKASKHKF
jgi:hypothetical protein